MRCPALGRMVPSTGGVCHLAPKDGTMTSHTPAHLSSVPVPRRRMRKLLVVPLAAGVALATGVAFAAWTSDATGFGEARSTTSIDSTIAPGSSAPDLYPGAASTVTVTVDNPNDYPVVVTAISAGSSALVNTTCAAGTVTTDARTVDATGILQSNGSTKTIAANGTGTYTLTTRMAGSAVDACKSQTFSLVLTGSLVSVA